MGWLLRGSRGALVGVLAVGAATGLFAQGCTREADQVRAGAPTATAAASDPDMAAASTADRLAPLTALGPCTAPDLVPDPAVDAVEGLVLPADAVVTSVVVQDPLTTVEGWVPATPLQVQADYVALPDVEIITVEDEVWESETLLADGEHRLFVKVQAVCEDGSIFLVVVAPDDDAGALPVPAGG